MFDAIQIPKSGERFYRYVATYTGENKSNFIVFHSYAQMLVIAAALAYEMNETIDDSKDTPSSNKDPVLGRFFNNGLDHIIYMISIGHARNHEILEDKFRMSRIIKGYADKGFKEMGRIQGKGDDWSVIINWVNKLKQSSP